MALVAELRDQRDALLTRVVLGAEAVSIGRSLTAGLCADDPYLDAVHATIVRSADGSYALQDCSAVNGVQKPGAKTRAHYPLQAGDEFLLGQTRLVIRDSDAPLAPTRRLRKMGLWSASGVPEAALAVLTIGAVGLNGWLGTYETSSGTEVLGVTVGFAIAALLWAGAWAIATRIVTHQFRFAAHLGIVCLAAGTLLAYGILADWVTFFFPLEREYDFDVITVVCAAVVVSAHLRVASRLTPWARRRIGAAVAVVLALVIVFGKLLDQEMFSAAPALKGSMKPVGAAFVPKGTLDDFGVFAAKIKAAADEKEAGE